MFYFQVTIESVEKQYVVEEEKQIKIGEFINVIDNKSPEQ